MRSRGDDVIANLRQRRNTSNDERVQQETSRRLYQPNRHGYKNKARYVHIDAQLVFHRGIGVTADACVGVRFAKLPGPGKWWERSATGKGER